MSDFQLTSEFEPKGDQPNAIEGLVEGLERGDSFQTLLGVTGSGKTFTMANAIAQVNRPALVIVHNKTLAAQLVSEFREFFPKNAVEYFVSYYDYYQPEAYIPTSDTYIEKDASINDEIERLRHAATQAVLTRRDVVIVASVSCIYGIGSPDEYRQAALTIDRGQTLDREKTLHRLVDMHFSRNDTALPRGTFRVKGDTLDIHPADEERFTRIQLFGDEVEKISVIDPVTGEILSELPAAVVFPATHYVTPWDRLETAIEAIEAELGERLKYFRSQNKPLEAERLEQRTKYDIEMMRELGYCSGIENYSRHLDGREPGVPPSTLIEFFPDDYLIFIDESHQTVPQIGGCAAMDRTRKTTLIDFGFRLPSAIDNRPLTFGEFEQRLNQVVFVSATPAGYEKKHSAQTVEQVVRPTGLVDPAIEVKPTEGQVDDLIEQIRQRAERKERVLVTTLTKRMAEDLASYLADLGIKVHYLHSEVQTLKRTEILRDLRLGEHDVIVGINLLREGLDLPEVTLVAILDADKEGFLRSETSLIQTMGRAARNVFGKVIMYADHVTDSMKRAIRETERRRQIQSEYNSEHGITPQTIQKEIRDLLVTPDEDKTLAAGLYEFDSITMERIPEVARKLEELMVEASKDLRFEEAASLRDQIVSLKKREDDHYERFDLVKEIAKERRRGRRRR